MVVRGAQRLIAIPPKGAVRERQTLAVIGLL